MTTLKLFMLKSHFNSVDKMFLSEFMYKPITWFFSCLWKYFCSFMFKIFLFLEKYIDRMVDDDYKKNDSAFSDIQMDKKREKILEFEEKGVVETECSVFKQSKFQYISGENAFGFIEKPEAESFTIQEMFVNFNEGEGVVMAEDFELDHARKEEKEEICKSFEADHAPISEDKLFYFSFFNNESVYQELVKKAEFFDEKEANDQEKVEDHVESEEVLKQNDEVFSDEETHSLEDICYEIQLFPKNQSFGQNSVQGSDIIGDEDGLTSDDSASHRHLNGFLNSDHFVEEDMGFIEMEPSLENLSANDADKFSSKEVDRVEETVANCEEMKLMDDLQEVPEANSSRKSWDTDEFASRKVDRVDEAEVNCEMMDDLVDRVDEAEVNCEMMDDLQEFAEHSSSRKSWDADEFASRKVDRVDETDGNCTKMKLMDDLQEFPEHNSSRKSWDIDEFASNDVDRVEQTDPNCEEMKLMDDLQEFPDHNSSRKSWDIDEFASKNVDRVEQTDANCEEMKLMDDLQEFPDHNSSQKSWDTDSDDDEDECDILLEHQNLVKQMKMEMRNSRITGLPTIAEDSESPKVVEDLKPLKINEKIEYKDCMEEIQKFYKSYAEKMRKLDILNYQTLNAISFLQLKDSEVFMSSKKSSISITKAFTLPSFLTNKQRKIFADPALKSICEMNRDLEIVYVGQICLSWEILSWQYGKAKELLEHDPQEYHSYNQVAGEYQQFQVLLQRFVEDEPFQGPRVQNYVRKRCILRGFLHVPSIRDDRSKEKHGGGHEGKKDVISILKLAEIIKETMHVFWEFLRADKREANFALKGVQGTQMDTAEIELFMAVKSDFQKKERRLKDVQRSGNCIVKKFQKHQEGRLSHPLFTSLVELKLVSRVLSLPRLKRDHLVWCQKKLSDINVVGRKVSMEPSFSLFPC